MEEPEAPRRRSPLVWILPLAGIVTLCVTGGTAAFLFFDARWRAGQRSEAGAVGALKTICTSQAIYREGDKDGNGVLDYAPDIAALAKCQLIDTVLGSGRKQGYRFKVARGPDARFNWTATAEPDVEEPPEDARFFFIDETAVVRYEKGRPATKASPPAGR